MQASEAAEAAIVSQSRPSEEGEGEEGTQDEVEVPLNDWNSMLQRFVGMPFYLELLNSFQLVWIFEDFRCFLVRFLSIRHASKTVNVVDAFVAAHRKVSSSFSCCFSFSLFCFYPPSCFSIFVLEGYKVVCPCF